MSNANDKDRDQAHEDALKALHGIGGTDDSEVEGEGTEEQHESEEVEGSEGTPSPAASGFVGMLAKQGKDGGGLDASEPSPQPMAGDSTAGLTPPKASTDKIYMAKEIKLPPGQTAVTPVGVAGGTGGATAGRRVRPAPGWYHAAVPIMYTLGGMLLLIGFWAIGALIYMKVKQPGGPGESVSYPFLTPTWDDETGIGGYTQGSHMMAIVMLACLPVSLAMGIMGGIMQRIIRATTPKE